MQEILLTLPSGEIVSVRQIALFRQDVLGQIAQIRAEAARHLGGSGAVVGAFGAPSFALAAEAGVLMLAGGLLANAAARVAVQNLQDAQARYNELREKPEYFPVSEIDGILSPDPTLWRCTRPEVPQCVNISKLNARDRDIFLAKHHKSPYDVHNHEVQIVAPMTYIFNGEDYLHVRDTDRARSVRWSSVVVYEPVAGPETS